MRPGDFFDYVPLERNLLRLTTAIDAILAVGSAAVLVAWLVGRPLLYSSSAPVMSAFTALSLLIMVLVRQARLHVDTWPMPLSLAMTGLVLGGNVSSIVMLTMTPAELWASFPNLVLTSVMTSIGLVLFCSYDLVIELRETPGSAFIMDDLLIHLALVPGGLSLLGYLLGNPTYLSVHADPRVGIAPLEMGFLGLYATAAIVSNPQAVPVAVPGRQLVEPPRVRGPVRESVRRAARRRAAPVEAGRERPRRGAVRDARRRRHDHVVPPDAGAGVEAVARRWRPDRGPESGRLRARRGKIGRAPKVPPHERHVMV